jgi:hypothetical protein
MGLVGFLALPMTRGVDLVQAAPQDFMAHPLHWMQWISEHRGTATAGPNFAWVLATRALRRADGLDLSSLTLALSGAEPVDPVAVDAFVELIRIGGAAAPEMVGAQRPAVRVLVTDRDLARRAGFGELEGQRVPISISTVEREICDRGVIPMHFDTAGQIVNLGKTKRLFSARQRVGLAVRDGGCRFMGCDRPPSWCEAHHIDEWLRDDGRTDIADGILMCKHHHLLIHDNGWRVTRDGANYSLVPPASLDPSRTPIPAPSKTRMVQRALEAAR